MLFMLYSPETMGRPQIALVQSPLADDRGAIPQLLLALPMHSTTAAAATLAMSVLYAHVTTNVSTALMIGGYVAGVIFIVCVVVGMLILMKFE
ncbi:hypothetical protein A0H81_05800 [Grifola frondosa]|uniref:Uncharacterized protein n=1 Tax=Grifola frondosa TaxID=5627 RepID=A0A1C7MCC0_GRIFR|nr:hypothetical protein A0H81_05800 [Grifola frondosa]